MKNMTINNAMKPDVSWFQANIGHKVICPSCGFDYAHPGEPHEVYRGDYQNDWDGRGSLTVIPFWGECGHNWELCFGFHKGNTFAFARITEPEGNQMND